MIKLTVNGDAVVVRTDIQKSTYEMLRSQNPKALTLYERDDDDILVPEFSLAFGTCGSLDNRGLICNGTDADGNLISTLAVDNLAKKQPEDQIKFLAKALAMGIARANKLTDQIVSAVEDIEAAETAAAASIEIVAG